ncbi:MAG TPA: diacylglycerol kinase family protein [Acidimicrobiia bacterium]|nr:diacylglycerol kinase family protein [Acidimicrobiia bacterium]
MRLTLIVNTTASSVTPRTRVVIQKALSADHDVTVMETARRGHAARIARGAAKAGAEVVVVMGGDGTLNEAADGLSGTETALAPLPGGSTNVYARAVGYSNDPIEATGQLLAALGHRAGDDEAASLPTFHRIGLGSVNGRRFLFHVGVGFDAAVVEQVERRSFLKRHLAHPLFVFSAFTTWFRHYEHDHPRFAVDLPTGSGREVIDDGYFAIVSKTDPYTFLGSRPLHVAPEATIESPLAITIFRTLGIGTLIPAAASALWKGRLLARHPKIMRRSHLHEFVVRGHGPVPYQVDGDYLGTADELRFTYEPESLTLVVPS